MTSPFIAPIIILQGKVLIDGFKSVCTVIPDDISVIKKGSNYLCSLDSVTDKNGSIQIAQ